VDRGGFDRRWLILCVTTIGTFMSILDSTIINVALPDILHDFNVDLDNGQYVLTVDLLFLAIVIPLSGFLADRVGMKRLFMLTLTGFTLSSALCGLAWDLPSLIAFRAIQGLSGGMMQPLSMAIVYSTITPLERGRFMALLGLPQLLAPILGPTVGGYIVEYASWRYIFLINLPIGIANLGLAQLLLPHFARKEDSRLDFRGFILAALAFPLLLLGLSEGADNGWTPVHLMMILGGALFLAAFIKVELMEDQPLFKLQLFQSDVFRIAMLMMFVLQISLYGIQYLLPLFLQEARGLSASQTGLILLPGGVASFISMNIGGRLYNNLGPRPLSLVGSGVLFLGTLAMAQMTANTSPLEIAGLSCIRGIALGLCFIPVQTAAYNTVSREDMPRATALTQVAMRLFGSVSTALITMVLLFSLQQHGAPDGSTITGGTAPIHTVVAAFDDGFYFMAAVALVAGVLSCFITDHVVDEEKRRIAEERILVTSGERSG
jgi:EmrB/QacA subfamily drug resistance transporter